MCCGRPPRSSLPNGRWAESFADDLNTRRGIVSGRVALLPRSTEIQPHVARIRPSPNSSLLQKGSTLREGCLLALSSASRKAPSMIERIYKATYKNLADTVKHLALYHTKSA